MPNIVALNKETHRDLRVLAAASVRYGDNQRFVPVVVTEFALLAMHYPILISKDSETGAFFCGAMLGFDVGENLFLQEGKGHDGYVPLNLRRPPFYTAGSDLAIDLDHPRVDASGLPLFTEQGEPAPYLESIMGLMRELRPGLEMTKIFLETLVTLKLIEPIKINVSFDDGTSRDLQGLYTISKDAVRNLTDDKAVELFRRGYLQLIYLVMASLNQVSVLARKKNLRLLDASDALSGSFG